MGRTRTDRDQLEAQRGFQVPYLLSGAERLDSDSGGARPARVSLRSNSRVASFSKNHLFHSQVREWFPRSQNKVLCTELTRAGVLTCLTSRIKISLFSFRP